MHSIIIADTSFLIAIGKLELFDQVKDLYKEIFITKEIAAEFQFYLPGWILIKEPVNFQLQSVLSSILDEGEASAIALAYDFPEVILIIDDLKARKEAKRLGFKITGTLGVLFKLKQNGLIPSLKERIIQLNEIGFRVSHEIIEEALNKAGEKN